MLPAWHIEPVWACTLWHGVEAFQQSELPYLMSPFRHTSHTPTLVREKYTQSQAIHIQYAESNPPTIHTHCPANTHTYWHSSSNTETHWHITEHKQNCIFTNTSGAISHPAGAPRYPTQFTHFPAMAWRIIAWGGGGGGGWGAEAAKMAH